MQSRRSSEWNRPRRAVASLLLLLALLLMPSVPHVAHAQQIPVRQALAPPMPQQAPAVYKGAGQAEEALALTSATALRAYLLRPAGPAAGGLQRSSAGASLGLDATEARGSRSRWLVIGGVAVLGVAATAAVLLLSDNEDSSGGGDGGGIPLPPARP